VSTAAEDRFASLQSERDLDALREANQPETLYLEFKTKRDSRDGILHSDDKGNFSDSLSAFANSDGGVLIWGIATTNRGGIDVAHALKPIAGIGEFRLRLGGYLKDAVQPYVDNVQIETIPGPEIDTGYLKCLIPASERAPHRAMATREYYRRSEQGRRRMEHFEIEDMFGRRARPALELTANLVGIPHYGPGWEGLQFSIENQGRALARYIGFIASSKHITFGPLPGLYHNLPPNAEGQTISWNDGGQLFLHAIPVVHHFVAVPFKRSTANVPFNIKVTWFCDHMRYREKVLTII